MLLSLPLPHFIIRGTMLIARFTISFFLTHYFLKQLGELKKENFGLKLRIYYMEDALRSKFGDSHKDWKLVSLSVCCVWIFIVTVELDDNTQSGSRPDWSR